MIIHADARHIPLIDGCVQCCVTSPPYFGLRDYGVSGQIGLEPTPDAYVAALVGVFREVRRVLADDGVLWLNLGDSYAGVGAQTGGTNSKEHGRRADRMFSPRISWAGMKSKDLMMIPARVALALQADGWYLRSDIIWSKPNPMPESVTDRPTKAHEYLFLLAKQERYYYDAAAIAEPLSTGTLDRWKGDPQRINPSPQGLSAGPVRGESGLGCKRYTGSATKDYASAGAQDPSAVKARIIDKQIAGGILRRNKRSVWTVPTMPYSGAHFATMPEQLVEPCILAGSRLGDLVFDPFIGSGTVGAMAERLGRRWVGCDLNPAYHRLAKKRTAQRGLRFDVRETERSASATSVDAVRECGDQAV